MTSIIHAQNSGRHAVAVDALRVLIVKDGDSYFARGIEIDYAATGCSIEDVQDRFGRGFCLTLAAHLKKFGAVDKLLKWAPRSVVQEYEDNKERYEFAQISLHELPDFPHEAEASVPFDHLRFVYPEARDTAACHA